MIVGVACTGHSECLPLIDGFVNQICVEFWCHEFLANVVELGVLALVTDCSLLPEVIFGKQTKFLRHSNLLIELVRDFVTVEKPSIHIRYRVLVTITNVQLFLRAIDPGIYEHDLVMIDPDRHVLELLRLIPDFFYHLLLLEHPLFLSLLDLFA